MIIYKNKGRYYFKVGSFDSSIKYFIFPHVKSSYKYAWEAEYDARRILKTMKTILAKETDVEEEREVEVSNMEKADDMIVYHYLQSYDSLVDKTSGISDSSEEEKRKVYEEIKIVVDNLLKIQKAFDKKSFQDNIAKIIKKFSILVKDNFNNFLKEDISKKAINVVNKYLTSNKHDYFSLNEEQEILEENAKKLCFCLQDKLPDCVYMIDINNKTITLVSCNKDIKYLTFIFNSDLFLVKILPHSYMPVLNSEDFYQNIFKPIFEILGHFCFSEKKFLIIKEKSFLPDFSLENSNFKIDGINTENKMPCVFEIAFYDKKWKLKEQKNIKEATSKYTEMDYIENGGAIVECIDKNLDSLYGKRGVVKQVIPLGVNIYVDINFGNIIVRLIESQIKIIKNEI